jgi:uncharacterized protein YbjT (DUF2867 family)
MAIESMVLLTGGSGFLGGHTLTALLAAGVADAAGPGKGLC